MKIGDNIYCYRITLDFIKNVASKSIEENQILGINERILVINDRQFTRLDLGKERFNMNGIINKTGAYHSKIGTLSDEIHAYMYTTESNSKKAYVKIKKELEKFIYEKFGRYTGATDILNTLEI